MALTRFEERIMTQVHRQRVSISEIHDGFFSTERPSRRTLQRAIASLVRRGVLIQTGEKRGTRYEKAK